MPPTEQETPETTIDEPHDNEETLSSRRFSEEVHVQDTTTTLPATSMTMISDKFIPGATLLMDRSTGTHSNVLSLTNPKTKELADNSSSSCSSLSSIDLDLSTVTSTTNIPPLLMVPQPRRAIANTEQVVHPPPSYPTTFTATADNPWYQNLGPQPSSAMSGGYPTHPYQPQSLPQWYYYSHPPPFHPGDPQDGNVHQNCTATPAYSSYPPPYAHAHHGDPHPALGPNDIVMHDGYHTYSTTTSPPYLSSSQHYDYYHPPTLSDAFAPPPNHPKRMPPFLPVLTSASTIGIAEQPTTTWGRVPPPTTDELIPHLATTTTATTQDSVARTVTTTSTTQNNKKDVLETTRRGQTNLRNRNRQAQKSKRFQEIDKIPVHERSRTEQQIWYMEQERRDQENYRARLRAELVKQQVQRIQALPVGQRSRSETAILEKYRRTQARRKETDRLRRERLKQAKEHARTRTPIKYTVGLTTGTTTTIHTGDGKPATITTALTSAFTTPRLLATTPREWSTSSLTWPSSSLYPTWTTGKGREDGPFGTFMSPHSVTPFFPSI